MSRLVSCALSCVGFSSGSFRFCTCYLICTFRSEYAVGTKFKSLEVLESTKISLISSQRTNSSLLRRAIPSSISDLCDNPEDLRLGSSPRRNSHLELQPQRQLHHAGREADIGGCDLAECSRVGRNARRVSG